MLAIQSIQSYIGPCNLNSFLQSSFCTASNRTKYKGFPQQILLIFWVCSLEVTISFLVPLLTFQGFVHSADTLFEPDGGGPACLGKAGDVHKFAGGAVGFGEIVLDGALELGDLFDEVGEFFNGDVVAGADVDGAGFVVGLHEEVAGVG